MVFRDQVIVYADAGALPAAGLQQLIDGVRGLDMDKVRAEIAAEGGE
jgi:thioredoxin 1